MRIKIKLEYIICLLIYCTISSCNVSKFLPEGELLYTGTDLNISTTVPVQGKKALDKELHALTPKSNSVFLGLRPGLFYHYKAQRPKPGFINKWLDKSFGQAPTYLSDINQEKLTSLLLNRLENNGFFYCPISSIVDSSSHFAGIEYSIKLVEPYTLSSFELDKDTLPIYSELNSILSRTKLKPGIRFNLKLLEAERLRIDTKLKQRGYYNFNSDFLIFEADTNNIKNKGFALFLRLKKSVPSNALIPYNVDSIIVYPNYSIKTSVSDSILPTIVNVEGVDFIQDELFFRPENLKPYLKLEEGKKYNSNDARLTRERLSDIGAYKYVNIRFKEQDTSRNLNGVGALTAEILLSPLTKRSVRAELQALTKSNGFVGPSLSLTYLNRNFSKTGQNLAISANFGYETQLLGGANTGLRSIAGGINIDWIIPRLVPFSPNKMGYSVPKTKVSIGADVLDRSKLYTLLSATGSFGYTWNGKKRIFHQINPVNLTYTKLSNTTLEFDSILLDNPLLARSFEQEFIAGLTYTFIYSELVKKNKKRPIFVTANFDIAGNLLNLINGNKSTFLNQEFAQYAKVDVDFQYYIRWKKSQAFVTRIFAGVGIPYGNSNTLPYVKQYFSGGPYSVRAFNIRSLGPGTFTSDGNATESFFDQSGNLKLEANIEYRFPIWTYLKGALFVDAGNVWLTGQNQKDETDSLINALYDFGAFGKDWISEIAVGVGFGLRVDIQGFVIRLDLASPVRVPYLPVESRTKVPFFSKGSENLVLNFAIGYPF